MSPADQPQAVAMRRSTDPPTLWLSLGLGSVLIHLVLFIVMSVTLTRMAKVQLDPEPTAVELVDSDAVQARSTAPSQTIAARPGAPSSSTPTDTQEQPSASRSQSSDFNPPVEPFTPLPSARPRRVPLRPQLQQPNPFRNIAPRSSTPSTNPISPRPSSPVQPSNPTSPSQDQPLPTNNPVQGTVPGSTAEPSGNTTATTEPKLPAEGERITQPPQGQSVAVTVLDASPPPVDVQKQPARPSYREKSISISYPSTLAKQTIRLRSSLVIGSDGSMLGVKETTLLSSGNAIDSGTLNGIAEQVFRQWQFEPARDESDGKLVTSPQSNLIVQAEVQLP